MYVLVTISEERGAQIIIAPVGYEIVRFCQLLMITKWEAIIL